MATQTSVYALGVLALLIALLVPAAVAVTDSAARDSYALTESETTAVSQSLEVVLESAQSPEATITLRDSETLESETQTLSEGNTSTYTIRDESVNVTLLDTGQKSAEVSIQYPRTYGWDENAEVFVHNLPFMLVLAFGVVVMGMVVALKP